jgi:hypothetical protein
MFRQTESGDKGDPVYIEIDPEPPRGGRADLIADVPELPDARDLDLGDRRLFERLIAEDRPGTSEMTFTNLWAWSGTHPVRIARIGESFLLWRGHAGTGALLPPLGTLDGEAVARALAWSESLGGRPEFTRVPRAIADRLAAADPRLAVVHDRDQDDYVYRAADLASLAGRRYHKKRNLTKQFQEAIRTEYRPITPDLLAACRAHQVAWCDVRECAIHPDLEAEDLAVKRVLDHWDALAVFGGALVGADGVVAFAVGEDLFPGTAVTHFEKAHARYPGAYQAINQAFAEGALAGFEFVNREQDLGSPGIRQAKESYYPAHRVEKFTVGLPAPA